MAPVPTLIGHNYFYVISNDESEKTCHFKHVSCEYRLDSCQKTKAQPE
jgi:hypothetical protein